MKRDRAYIRRCKKEDRLTRLKFNAIYSEFNRCVPWRVNVFTRNSYSALRARKTAFKDYIVGIRYDGHDEEELLMLESFAYDIADAFFQWREVRAYRLENKLLRIRNSIMKMMKRKGE